MDQELIDELDALLEFAEEAKEQIYYKLEILRLRYPDRDWDKLLRLTAIAAVSLPSQPAP